MKTKSTVKGGGWSNQHNQRLRLKTRVRAGQVTPNV
jgi:hypothetical protein